MVIQRSTSNRPGEYLELARARKIYSSYASDISALGLGVEADDIFGSCTDPDQLDARLDQLVTERTRTIQGKYHHSRSVGQDTDSDGGLSNAIRKIEG